MLAAGGIGSRRSRSPPRWRSGAQGVWAGSLWLTVEEADLPPAQKQQLLDADSRDTVRVALVHRQAVPHAQNDWTEAWERPDTPDPLPMPLQYMVSGNCVARQPPLRRQGRRRAFNPVGQVVGQLDTVEKTAAVIQRLVEEYLEATERLDALERGRARPS